jgi:hypothetical protein
VTLVLLAHGSANPAGARVVEAVAERVRYRLPGVPVRVAYVEVARPSLPEVLAEVADEAVVVPLACAQGYAVTATPRAVGTLVATIFGPERLLAGVMAERLRAAGARVLLTRDADVAVDLAARPALAVATDADLLVSVHNNAFGDEAKPARDHGTSTYWFQPLSADLARTLDRRIAETTGIPDLGAKWGNLALVRPTWLPSVLTESMFMPIPEQESALRDPGFLDRLADAHVRGIEDFLRLRAGEGAP